MIDKHDLIKEIANYYGRWSCDPSSYDFVMDKMTDDCLAWVKNKLMTTTSGYKRMPTPRDFEEVATQYHREQTNYHVPVEDVVECYYCGMTGLIPRIENQEELIYIHHYSCDCPTGKHRESQKIKPYFEVFEKIQFKNDDEFDYPFIVQMKMWELTMEKRTGKMEEFK